MGTIRVLIIGISFLMLNSSMFGQEEKNGIFADIITSKGLIQVQLHYDKVPMTVANFIGLATGQVSNSFKGENEPYYDGLKFHRVISGKIIQGGDPTGTGSGMPGYKFKDEFNSELKHEKEGVLSMANYGKNTNGSQFFITMIPAPHLDKKHAVFGEVISGMEVVKTIEKNDKIESIKIIRKGENAEKFSILENFNEKNKKKL